MKRYRHVIAMLSSLLVMFVIWGCKKVEEPVVTAIILDTENVKKNYFQNEKLDLSGIKVKSIYSDGRIVEVTEYETSMKSGNPFEKSGEIEITVSALGRNAAFKIFVADVQVISLDLDTENVKKEYYQSEKVDLANLKVTATYNDGTESEITEFETSLKTGDSFDESGNVEVTVSFSGATASFGVFVKKVEFENITLNTENVKKEYYQSEKLDLKNLVVTANYNDGTKKDVTAYTTNPVNETVLSVLGKNEVTISYEGKSAVLEVEVIKNYLSLISIELPEYSDVTNLLLKDGNSFVAKEGFASYKWFLDGVPVSNTTNSYTPDLSALKCGVHELMVIVKDAKENSYSATATFVIEL